MAQQKRPVFPQSTAPWNDFCYELALRKQNKQN